MCHHASGGEFSWIKSLYLIGVFVSVLGNSRLNLFCTNFHTTFLYSFFPKTLMSFMYSLFSSPFWCIYVCVYIYIHVWIWVHVCMCVSQKSTLGCLSLGVVHLVYVYTYVLKYVLLTWNSPNFLGARPGELLCSVTSVPGFLFVHF